MNTDGYSVAEAAELLGYSTREIHRRIKRGQLNKIQAGGKGCTITIPRAEVDAIVASNAKVIATAETPPEPVKKDGWLPFQYFN